MKFLAPFAVIFFFLLFILVKFSPAVSLLVSGVHHRFFPDGYVVVGLPEDYQGHFLFYRKAQKSNSLVKLTLPQEGIAEVTPEQEAELLKSAKAGWIDFLTPSGKKVKSTLIQRGTKQHIISDWGGHVQVTWGTIGQKATQFFHLEPAYQEAMIRKVPFKDVAPLWDKDLVKSQSSVKFKLESPEMKYFVVESSNGEPCAHPETAEVLIDQRGMGKIDCALHPLQLNFERRFEVQYSNWIGEDRSHYVLPLAYDRLKEKTYFYYWVSTREGMGLFDLSSYGKEVDREALKKIPVIFKKSKKSISEIFGELAL